MNAAPDREQSLGAFVRERRVSLGLSQLALAELAGVGRRALAELEADKPTLRLDVANRVLGVFGMRVGPVPAPRPGGVS